MEIVQAIGIGIVATFAVLIIKSHRPEIAIQITIAAGLVIIVLLLGRITSIVKMLEEFAAKSDLDFKYFSLLLKIVGIAYICEFGAEVCRDAGETAIASKIELAGKVVILAMAVPIVSALVEIMAGILP